MCWNFGENNHFSFSTNNQEIYFEIGLGSLPEIYNDFFSSIRHKFIENKSGQLIFSYKISSCGCEKINKPLRRKKDGHPDDYSYIIADRRVLNDGQPKQIKQSTLQNIIKENNILFYTGAGISLASSVPAMNELHELLELEVGAGFLFSLEKAIKAPFEFADKIKQFHKACLYSPATLAHYALKDISFYKNAPLVTENLDCLHEASGIFPYRINPQQLRKGVKGKGIGQFDFIICIGLSFDDRGFLGWYKNQNPKGKIIAIDLFQPSYLGDEDYWLCRDIQIAIPEIRDAVILKEEKV